MEVTYLNDWKYKYVFTEYTFSEVEEQIKEQRDFIELDLMLKKQEVNYEDDAKVYVSRKWIINIMIKR